MINIVGLGYGDIDDLTIGILKMLKRTKTVFVKTFRHPVIKSLRDEGINFKDYNELYNNIIGEGKLTDDVVYAVPGNPLEDDKLINVCKERKLEYRIYEAAGIRGFIQKCINEEIGEVNIINSCNIDKKEINRQNEIVITNLEDESTVNKIKLKLLEVYFEDTYIYHLKIGEYKKCDRYTIKDINKIKDLDEQSIFYIRRNSKGKRNIYDLIDIVEILRGENGCPWDKEQTHESIKKDIVEECYEVLDAIEKKDNDAIIEELGDVLFQVMFHASIGNEKDEFTLLDITDGISNKMIYRHPHVFGNVNVNTTEDVLVNWDELKKHEKNFENLTDELNGVAKALPALIRAKKIQKKAKKVGFDWDDISGAFEKVKEELNEVMDVYKSEKMVRIKEEIGDLLFSCVNVSRFLEIDPEEALNLTTDKFIRRFSYIENKAKEMNSNLEEMSLSDMDKLWDEAKRLEKK